MRIFAVLLVTLQVLQIVDAQTAKGCTKDKCYSAVAIQGSYNPRAAVRKADCQSALSTVIFDRTVTQTNYVTLAIAPATTTQTIYKATVTKTLPYGSTTVVKVKRDIPTTAQAQSQITNAPSLDDAETNEVLPRDKVCTEIILFTCPSSNSSINFLSNRC